MTQDHTGRALTCEAIVGPRYGAAEVLQLQAWEIPPPGPGEIRLRVETAGISFADVLMVQGIHPERRNPPFVPGWDVVGLIESIGPGVEGLAIGDRVAALSIIGGWAEHAVVPAARAVPVPRGIAATEAVCLVMDYVVAYQMLTRSVQARPGDAALVQGAAGGVGTAVVQLARRMDLRVLGTDREAKRSHVEAEGAVLIDYEREDVVDRCRELTGGDGVDYAFDGIGATVSTSWRCLRPGGHLVWFGLVTMLAGGDRGLSHTMATMSSVAATFAANIVPGGRRTTLYSIQGLAERHPEWYRADLTALLAMLAAGQIEPRIATTWTLGEIPAAVEALASGAVTGKQIVAVAAPVLPTPVTPANRRST